MERDRENGDQATHNTHARSPEAVRRAAVLAGESKPQTDEIFVVRVFLCAEMSKAGEEGKRGK